MRDGYELEKMKTANAKIVVNMGEGAVAGAPEIIVSPAIGSCVVVTLYDTRLKIGGLAHIMMPKREIRVKSEELRVEVSPESVGPLDCRFADTAINVLFEKLLQEGAVLNNMEAKMTGGAKLFPFYNGDSTGIGEHNIVSIKRILQSRRITLAGWDTGGSHGRSVEFHLNSGRLIIRALGRHKKEI